MCERLICRMREPWVHSKGQMEWVGHDSFCLWHHFVVAIARERELLLPPPFLGGGVLWEGVLPSPQAGTTISGYNPPIPPPPYYQDEPWALTFPPLSLHRIPPYFCKTAEWGRVVRWICWNKVTIYLLWTLYCKIKCAQVVESYHLNVNVWG